MSPFKLIPTVCVLLMAMSLQQTSEATDLDYFELKTELRSTSAPDQLFELLTPKSVGIDFQQPIDLAHPKKYLYVGGYASAGVAIGDLNGDGLPDVMFTGGPVANRVYLQTPTTDASLKFKDATDRLGLAGHGAWSAGVTFVDLDADGDLDIYICNYDEPNELYINQTDSQGTPRFVESAAAIGLDLVDATFQSSFCDYDLDGDLDVLVTSYQYVNPAGRPGELPVRQDGNRYEVLPDYQKYYDIVRDVRGKQVFRNVGRRDYLMKNLRQEQGKLRFVDATEAAGLSGRGVANSAIWWDFDNDQHPDIFVANDFKVPDQLWRNNGDGTFTDVVKAAFPHITWFSMGSDVGDVNNDGRLDLFVSDMAGTSHYRSKVTMGEMGNNQDFLKFADPQQYMRNALMINTGTPRFLEAAYMANLSSSDWTWTTKFADFDNDGRVDVYLTNGAARMFNHSDFQATNEQRIGKTQWDIWEKTSPRNEENLAFRNTGDFRFENVGEHWGLARSSMSYAAAHGDLDLDGDLDLVVVNLDEPVSVYRNQLDRSRHSVRVELLADSTNQTSTLGAKVRIESQGQVQVRQYSPNTGFQSCNEPAIHFGLSDAMEVDKLTITWPGGYEQTHGNLPANRSYRIAKLPNATTTSPSPSASEKRWFVQSRTFPSFRHQEKPFDDFVRQPLLAYAHSQLGPGLAVADVDGDGDLDYYHGKSKEGRRAIYEQRPDRVGVKTLLTGEESYEDMGMLFFDADRDGDRDLYVVSGSVEGTETDDSLQDRLYINDGQGGFRRDREALPDLRDSGSVVCGADFDRDGDIDLFVGSRVVPGRYPVAPQSRLLRNTSESGRPRFVELAAQRAPGLADTGLVTSATWADVDNDGWQDLMVTHEWGPVKFYRNESNEGQRVLVDRTEQAGLASRTGWWNGIAAGDLDQDGDLDLVVTNFGLNTQYHASEKKPELLYYGEFDDSGKPHLLEAKFEANKCYPRRGMSCSSHAMPFVRQKLQTFHNFGLATLDEIYTPQRLADALRLEANTLESGILLNRSKETASDLPSFDFVPLPRLAQIAPSFGISLRDFNADGVLDIVLAQNFYPTQAETGHMDGGVSLVLAGIPDSQAEYRPLWPLESGILVPGDATSSCSCDFNQDGVLDLIIATNDGPVYAYEGRRHAGGQLAVTLVGRKGNLGCVGARVTLTCTDSSEQMREVHAGGGYLTQQSNKVYFGLGEQQAKSLVVRWPNGQTTRQNVAPSTKTITLRQPTN